jgi:pantetheine-phosphate adenylyltransferase
MNKAIKRIAVYPGTFDPITNGHLDIIKRASCLFDTIIVAVSKNFRKNSLFSWEERRELAEKAVHNWNHIQVDFFDGLLVDFAHQSKACAIIRGIRAVSDFEYEFQMALMNRKLAPDLETVYLMPSEEYTYLNSTLVKEIAMLGGKLESFLPRHVVLALTKKVESMCS